MPIYQEVGDLRNEAITLNNIGGIYSSIGQLEKALSFYEQALPIIRQIGDVRNEAITLNNIGSINEDNRQLEEALKFYDQALAIYTDIGDVRGSANTLNNIGSVYKDVLEPEKAIPFYEKALSFYEEIGDKNGEATVLNNIAVISQRTNEYDKAVNFLDQALILRKEIKDTQGEIITLGNLAFLEQERGNLNKANSYSQKSIELIESNRGEIISPEIKTNYFATVNDSYQLGIKILMELHQENPNQGYDIEAFNLSERSRSRTLTELLTEAKVNIRKGIKPELLEQEKSLLFQIESIEQQISELYSQNPNSDQLLEKVKPKEEELIALTDEYEELKNTIRRQSPEYASLKFPQSLTLKQIQNQLLDEDTLLIQYSLGEQSSYMWVVTKEKMKSYSLPPREKIESLAKNFRNFSAIKPPLSGQKNNHKLGEQIAQELSQILFGEISQDFNQKRIAIVADGALNYLPFTALPSPNNQDSYLMELFEIVSLPSATSLATIRQFREDKKVKNNNIAIFADPVFSENDKRLKNKTAQINDNQNNQDGGLNLFALLKIPQTMAINTRNSNELFLKRLTYTAIEAEIIESYFPDNQTISFLDFDASLDNIQQEDLSSYNILHIATHGIFNESQPMLSGLIFSRFDSQGNSKNGYLRFNDIFNLNLPKTELVVLSACETGLGENIRGEGLVGLTRGFMYAGSPRILVSLWQIDDQGTSEMMKRFYRFMLEDGLTPAQALKKAQLEMQQTEKWNDPYYWAAFTLQGEWN